MVGVALLVCAVVRAGWGLGALDVLHRSLVSRSNLQFDATQPLVLAAAARPASSVLYLAETPLYFYLAHGADRFGAVYYPAVSRTADESRWVQSNAELEFVVGLNPAAGLLLGPDDVLSIESAVGGESCRLQFAAPRTKPVLISWAAGDQSAATRQTLEADGGVAIRLAGNRPLNLRVERPPFEGLRVTGLQCDRQATRWPWQSGITMRRQTAGGEGRAIRFDLPSRTLFPNRAAMVLNDVGDTYVLQLR